MQTGVPKYSGCDWILIRDKTISNAEKIVLNGRDLTECMWDCENIENFTCGSIEWRYQTNECRLNKLHSYSYGATISSQTYTDLMDFVCIEGNFFNYYNP